MTPDPYQSLPTEERKAAYMRHSEASMARRAQWIEDFQAAGKDASTLPRARSLAFHAPWQVSLAAALEHADLVVEGTVTKVVYTPSSTVGTVRLGAIHKASGAAVAHLGTPQPTEVQVALGYSPEPPTPRYPEGVLVFSENVPVLLPGARAVLLLKLSLHQTEKLPPFQIQGFTGGYEIDASGNITPAHGNPFADQVRGLSQEQFRSLIARELSNIPPAGAAPAATQPTPTPETRAVPIPMGQPINLAQQLGLDRARSAYLKGPAMLPGPVTDIDGERLTAIVVALAKPRPVVAGRLDPLRMEQEERGVVFVIFKLADGQSAALEYRRTRGTLTSYADRTSPLTVPAPPDFARLLGLD